MSKLFDSETGEEQVDSINEYPALGTYFRYLKGDLPKNDKSYESDDLCFVKSISFDDDKITIRSISNEYTVPLNELVSNFEFVADGQAARAERIRNVQMDLIELGNEFNHLQENINAFSPHVDSDGNLSGVALPAFESGDFEPVPEVDNDSALVLAPRQISGSTQLKKSASLIRNKVTKLQNNLESKKSLLDLMVKEQTAAMLAKIEEQTKGIKLMLERATEAIDTVNIYLGRDESIVQIAEGIPAPKETPLTIRQMVLYMDEECAIAAEDGGIDYRDIGAFDKWLTTNPAHLAQVFPEQKGIVALKPRRKPFEYRTGNAMLDAQLNKNNFETYFLLRNGQNLYRIATTYEVGSRILPTQSEFSQFFMERVKNPDTGEIEENPVVPGSKTYMEAMDKAGKIRKHYLKLALMIQGIIDRTTIYQPLPRRFNICDPMDYGDFIHVINDAERGLPDGRIRFTDWIKDLNSRIKIGTRVMGAWTSWQEGLGQYNQKIETYRRTRTENHRLSPKSAGYPNTDEIYILEGRKDNGYFFHYRETRYSYHYGRNIESKKRSTCTIMESDSFVLNFDEAQVEDMEFYINSRFDRKDYATMIPLLKVALELKREEKEQEEPFLMLLTGQLMKEFAIDSEDARKAAVELASWWKFKNRIHRALLSDDSKAIRMILTEYKSRNSRSADDSKYNTFKNHVLGLYPNALLIGHKNASEYVALIPESNRNVHVREITFKFTVRNNEISVVKDNRWRLVDKRYESWGIIYQSDKWDEWEIGAVAANRLTDPEFFNLAKDAIKKYIFGGKILLAVSVSKSNETGKDSLKIWFVNTPDADEYNVKISSNHSTNEHIKLLNLESHRLNSVDNKYQYFQNREVLWTRKNGLVEIHEEYKTWRYESGYDSHAFMEWIKEAEDTSYSMHYAEWNTDGKEKKHGRKDRIVWYNRQVLQEWKKEYSYVLLVTEKAEKIRRHASKASEQFGEHWREVKEKNAYQAFLDEFGDPELWEGHKKQKNMSFYVHGPEEIKQVSRMLSLLGIDVIGMTGAELIRKAFNVDSYVQELLIPKIKDPEQFITESIEKYKIDFDFVIKQPVMTSYDKEPYQRVLPEDVLMLIPSEEEINKKVVEIEEKLKSGKRSHSHF